MPRQADKYKTVYINGDVKESTNADTGKQENRKHVLLRCISILEDKTVVTAEEKDSLVIMPNYGF